MTYPHTLHGTGKRFGTKTERRARFYVRPNTQKILGCRYMFCEAPWRPCICRFGGPNHTCDTPMCLSDSLSRNTHTTTQDSPASNVFKPWEPPTFSSQPPEASHKGTSQAHSAGMPYTIYFSGPLRSNAPRYWIQPPKQSHMPMTSSRSAALKPAYSNKPTWYLRSPRYSNLTSPIPNFAPTSSHTTGPT